MTRISLVSVVYCSLETPDRSAAPYTHQWHTKPRILGLNPVLIRSRLIWIEFGAQCFLPCSKHWLPRQQGKLNDCFKSPSEYGRVCEFTVFLFYSRGLTAVGVGSTQGWAAPNWLNEPVERMPWYPRVVYCNGWPCTIASRARVRHCFPKLQRAGPAFACYQDPSSSFSRVRLSPGSVLDGAKDLVRGLAAGLARGYGLRPVECLLPPGIVLHPESNVHGVQHRYHLLSVEKSNDTPTRVTATPVASFGLPTCGRRLAAQLLLSGHLSA
jgi:hypothetical protein